MKVSTRILILYLVIVISSCARDKIVTHNYYFDPLSGSDSASGTSSNSAFRSLTRISHLKLLPGDSILLRSGAVFHEFMYISCKGDSGKPIVIGKYGGWERPHIKGDATQLQAVHIYNCEHIVIRDLEISNRCDTPVINLNGLLVQVRDYGTAKDITLDNLYVHDVYGCLIKEKGGGNAIQLLNVAENDSLLRSSRFDGLIVQNCHIQNCQRNGIMMWGNWVRRKWNPSLNVIIRNNLIEGVPGDGIVPVACESPLIEYNIMRDCPGTLPATEACDGIWPWSCDNATIQYNIVSDHKSVVDGYGFDSDWNSTNSLFQYNLSYNNDGGFLLVCNPGGWAKDWNIGNTGTVVRYNVSINDGIRSYIPEGKKKYFSPVIHMTGELKNSLIEKNLFYVSRKPSKEVDKTILSLTDWFAFPDSTFFRNNYILVEEPNRMVDPTKSTNTFFADNLYIGELTVPETGFVKYNGNFDRDMWLDKEDPNWQNLIKFIGNKSVPVNGVEIPVLKIIGVDN